MVFSPFVFMAMGELDALVPLRVNNVWQMLGNQGGQLVRYTSNDLVRWVQAELRVSGPDELPWFAPGSQVAVVGMNGVFHLFWGSERRICLATSDDLRTWKVFRGNPVLELDEEMYEGGELVDPSVCFCREDGLWWLLAGAQGVTELSAQGGCVALAKSADLRRWQWYPPLWGPGFDRACVSPQIIPHRGRWFLIYRDVETLYRVANDASGPFRRPPLRELYTDGVYGGTRMVPLNDGWVAFPRLACGSEAQTTGLPLVPREVRIQLDGSLTERVAKPVLEAMSKLPLGEDPSVSREMLAGEWEYPRKDVARSVGDEGGFVRFPAVNGAYYLEADVVVEQIDVDVIVHVSCEENGESLAQLVLSPRMERAILRVTGDGPEASRWLPMPVNKIIHLQVFVQERVVDVIVDERISVSGLMREKATGALGVSFRDGKAKVGQMVWRPLP